jgi:hypothetical protein
MLVECGVVFELAQSVGAAISNTPNPKLSPTQAVATGLAGHSMPPRGLVYLIEEKVFTQFSDEVKKEG